jgi:hypothetical protein
MEKAALTLTPSQISLLQQAATLLAKASLVLQQVSAAPHAEVILDTPTDIPVDQRWFWTKEWQAREREAEADIAAGRVQTFETVDELLLALGL